MGVCKCVKGSLLDTAIHSIKSMTKCDEVLC